MEYAILGPLGMRENGRSYTPTAPKQRQLLALLLLNANKVVSAGTCIQELWEERPPATALSTLQSYILQLRRILRNVPDAGLDVGGARDARRVLETRDGGYLLNVRAGDLDVTKFMSLVHEGRIALRRDDFAASALLARALNIWQGAALADVHIGPILRTHLTRLEEERISVQEQRIEADLRLGRHHELIGELSALTMECPTHENLHAQLMLALHRSGRRIQALEVVQRLYQVLHDELGLGPSPRMRNLHQAILACDPAIDAPATPSGILLTLDLPALAGHSMSAG